MKHVTNRTIYAAALILLIGACSTPADLRLQGPALEQKSLRNAKDVAACVAEAWENAGVYLAQVNMKIIKNGYSVAIRGDTATALLADITDTSSGGSVTSLYSLRATPTKKFSDAVISCQKG